MCLPDKPDNPTTLNLETWTMLLENDPDRNFLLEGIGNGFCIIGNDVDTQEKPTIISAIGAIPKSEKSVRLIHDASRPMGLGLNDYVSTHWDIKGSSNDP